MNWVNKDDQFIHELLYASGYSGVGAAFYSRFSSKDKSLSVESKKQLFNAWGKYNANRIYDLLTNKLEDPSCIDEVVFSLIGVPFESKEKEAISNHITCLELFLYYFCGSRMSRLGTPNVMQVVKQCMCAFYLYGYSWGVHWFDKFK